MDEAYDGSKARFLDTLKPLIRIPMNRSEGTFEGAEELFISSLTDFYFLRVCASSTDGWACSFA